MSLLGKIKKPPFYAVVYTTPPKEYQGGDFGGTASLLVALAAMQPGYLGFQSEQAAEGRTVAVCYWDGYAALANWQRKAEAWVADPPGLDGFVCATGCLWPWLDEKRQANLEFAARSVA
jgi:heme-degrading monooxygenase HmoA